ncbi:Amuc_1100 family pilus-like protein [Kamptonema cortianum]|nr:Amuc_1100 family pilus-like protein [Kamptonema cortianum]MDL5049726.1 Amuc_1100 family pilus-like protein [Oscillatoria amoena NRMC-F 0135]
MKIKDHLTVIVISSVTLVLGLVGLYLISSAKSGLETAKGELDALRMRMGPVLNYKPFPSVENIKAVEKNQQAILQAKQQFMDYFNNPDIEKEDVEPIVLRNRIVDFRQEMGALTKQKGVITPQDFGFSFEMYGQVLPDKRNTEILAQQLSTLAVVMPLVIESGIQEIKTVSRASLIDEKPAPGARPSNLKVSEDEELGFRRLPFEVSFIGDINNLREIVNKMSQSRNLLVVKDVMIKNHNLKIPTLAQMNTEEALEAQKNSSAPIIIFGLEKIEVSIRFDLLIFESVVPAQTQEANP